MAVEKVQFITNPMINEDGMWYGRHIIVFGKDEAECLDALVQQFGEETVYGDHPMTDQFQYELVTKFTRRGDIDRSNEPWLNVLGQHCAKRMGFSELRRIVDILT